MDEASYDERTIQFWPKQAWTYVLIGCGRGYDFAHYQLAMRRTGVWFMVESYLDLGRFHDIRQVEDISKADPFKG